MFSAALALPSEHKSIISIFSSPPCWNFVPAVSPVIASHRLKSAFTSFILGCIIFLSLFSSRSLVLKLSGITLVFKSEWKAMQRFLLEFTQEFETEVWEVQSVLVSSTIDSKTWRGHHGWWVSFLSLLVIWKEASGFSLDGFKWSSVLCYV